ncbi:hypothetical protein LCGC14_1788780 [marine sediment metagenome]|uniref:Uncharacterized protein n=1 Tax=marine sediment metagenome TaxID=412755 RepID=A0A0F9J819_9ZZZZ
MSWDWSWDDRNYYQATHVSYRRYGWWWYRITHAPNGMLMGWEVAFPVRQWWSRKRRPEELLDEAFA